MLGLYVLARPEMGAVRTSSMRARVDGSGGAWDMFAIVDTGGRQEKVTEGAVVVVDRLGADAGAEVTFDKVLIIETGDNVVVGTPYVAGASVTGVVLEETKGKK